MPVWDAWGVPKESERERGLSAFPAGGRTPNPRAFAQPLVHVGTAFVTLGKMLPKVGSF